MAINIHSIPLPSVSPTWRQASLVVTKSHVVFLMLEIYAPGSIDFPAWGKLPLHRYGRFQSCILKIFNSILEISKGGYFRAPDVVDYIDRPEVQERLGKKTKILLRTAQRWLKRLSLRHLGIQVQVESTSHRSYQVSDPLFSPGVLGFHLLASHPFASIPVVFPPLFGAHL